MSILLCSFKSIGKFFIIFHLYVNTNRVPADLAQAIYCTAIREGSEDEWEFLWNKLNKENVFDERRLLLRGLGCTIKPELIKVIILQLSFNQILVI